MKIAEFIQGYLRDRMKKAGCLAVYDPDRRYLELCKGMDSSQVCVVDASESSIESRHAALIAFRDLHKEKREGLLVYVPAKPPLDDAHKQQDPFALYMVAGDYFPKEDGDDYLDLCLKAKPDHATEIRKLFQECGGSPGFEVIDALGKGAQWPQLRAKLRVESAMEILMALLAPSPRQREDLKGDDSWVTEAHAFFKAALGLQLKTKGRSWDAISTELWRFVLFSEFAFDLPVSLPDALGNVPRAPEEARTIIDALCDALRRDPSHRASYIQRAEEIEKELELATLCADISDFGKRDTFSFEERTFLRNAIQGLCAGDADPCRKVLEDRKYSVWSGKGENQAQWELVRASLNLMEKCEDLDGQLAEKTRNLSDLLDFYTGFFREADRLHRELEQAGGECMEGLDLLGEVLEFSRRRYRQLSGKLQGQFMRLIEKEGWPCAGRMQNSQVFNTHVAERLKEAHRRVAYFMVDALRYELGVELEKMLSEEAPVELLSACAMLPSITPVGMASLLPGAHTDLCLDADGSTLVPRMGADNVGNVTQRMAFLRKRFGDRFSEMKLDEFVRSKPAIPESVDLLVLRSNEIDSQLEANPESTLGLVISTLRLIRVAIHNLKGLGFKDIVIATDHGFFLNACSEAGDVCAKPVGKWPVSAHDRMLMGQGNGDAHSLVTDSIKLGIRSNLPQVALPKSMAPYSAGHLYFHGGLSLQEAIVPVLLVRSNGGDSSTEESVMTVNLSYRNGAKRITTRVPVIDMEMPGGIMFAERPLEVLLEAHDAKGKVVGEPRPGGDVNPATHTVTLTPGKRKQIAFRMDGEFEGKFTIKAMNPITMAIYDKLSLETDYTV